MKKLLLLITIIGFTFISVTKAQFKEGDFEFSFSGSFSSLTEESTFGSSSPYSGSNNSSQTYKYALLSFSPGYYIFNGISIEAEFGVSAIEKSKPSQYVIVNLGLTHLFPGTKVAIFFHGGYGLSNSISIPYLNNSILISSDKFDIKVLNLGAGFKFLATPSVVLHAELNYRVNTWTDDYTLYHVDNKISNIGLILGFSILI